MPRRWQAWTLIITVNYHDDIYGPEVHEVGPHVVSCMLYIQVIAKA